MTKTRNKPSFKYQVEFAQELTNAWLAGYEDHVRNILRIIPDNCQTPYVAAAMATALSQVSLEEAIKFCNFLHPDE